MKAISRKLPIGAEVQRAGGVHFRVWAPRTRHAAVQIEGDSFPLEAEGNGYYSGIVEAAFTGTLYKIALDHGTFPDPASRFQPQGPHGPSEVVDASRFAWLDRQWCGVPKEDVVLYEMHIGTFTAEGTWAAAQEELPELRDLGITTLEIMPVAEFSGNFGWGYDGVDLFAPTRLYGRPDDLREFINRAHELGLMVILDVVYNHLGPDGNYLGEFSENYFSNKYKCEWGEALNLDGENSGPVREFFLSNARYWVDEYHFDGFRLDATQQIFDSSPTHLLREITTAVREIGAGRNIYIIGENEPQEARMVLPPDKNGHGLDAIWNDDFHHTAMVAATGQVEAYYLDYQGAPQEFISAAKYGFLYQGQWYRWQQQRRGTPAFDLSPLNFVVFLQNHDQVANSVRGDRLHQVTSPGLFRALTALLLLGPATPMLFQGQEFAASAPFLYFADHKPELAKMVTEGRREFLGQFRSAAARDCAGRLPEPGDEGTFRRCKLHFAERTTHAEVYQLHRDLLRLRREDPVIRHAEFLDGAVLGERAFVLRYFSEFCEDRLLIINLGPTVYLNPAPEPLLAPVAGHGWRVLWSSEMPDYGGRGTPPLETRQNWILPPYAAVLLGPGKNNELPHAQISQKN